MLDAFLTLEHNQPTGFGVTPAVMSTAGSLMVLGRVKELYGGGYEGEWIGSFEETWWSEYTMYRLALNFYKGEIVSRSEQ